MKPINDLPIIFIVGASRSGTTMLSRILGRNPRVFTFRELHFFEQIWEPGASAALTREQMRRIAARLLTIQRDGYLHQGAPERYSAEADAVIQALDDRAQPPELFAAFLKYEVTRQSKDIACDQTPRNALFAEEILSLYPNAFIVNAVRDPRDVILSQRNRWRRRALAGGKVPLREAVRYWVNYHPITMSLLWNGTIRSTMRFKNHPRMIQIKFEEFTLQPEEKLKALCAFLGLDYAPEMLQVPQIGSSHGADQPDEIGVNPQMAGRWQKAKAGDLIDLAICQWISRDNMQTLGYAPAPIPVNWIGVIAALITWPVKAGLAALFNVGKSKNIFSAAWRRARHFLR
jgi:hypothetical protein